MRILRMLLPAMAIATGSSAVPLDGPDAEAIGRYLEGRPFERPYDREYAMIEMKPIERFHYLDRFPRLRFYVFPTQASSLRGHMALAVTGAGEVHAVGEEDGFNRMIRTEPVHIADPAAAEDLARDSLRLRFIHAEVWDGVEDGVNIIDGVDDIPFTDGDPEHEVERLDLELQDRLRPVAVEALEDHFVFQAYSWAPFDGSIASPFFVTGG